MTQWLEVVPAYGRDYKNQKSVIADWKDGKDFRDTVTGAYVNREDAERLNLKVIVRYDGLRKVMQIG